MVFRVSDGHYDGTSITLRACLYVLLAVQFPYDTLAHVLAGWELDGTALAQHHTMASKTSMYLNVLQYEKYLDRVLSAVGNSSVSVSTASAACQHRGSRASALLLPLYAGSVIYTNTLLYGCHRCYLNRLISRSYCWTPRDTSAKTSRCAEQSVLCFVQPYSSRVNLNTSMSTLSLVSRSRSTDILACTQRDIVS